jgi:hypothetical protein
LQQLHEAPASSEAVWKKLEDEIHLVQEMIQMDKREITEIQESETKNLEYLNQIIQKQAEAIRQCLEPTPTETQTEDGESEDGESEGMEVSDSCL